MLEQLDLTKQLSEAEYDRRMKALHLKLYDLGHAVFESRTPVVLLFEGWRQSGQGRAIAELTERLDPRGFRVYAPGEPNECEIGYPWLYRFWCKTPAYGQMSIFHGSWHRRVFQDRATKRVSKPEWRQAFEDIREFERTLADDGVVICKFFFHIDYAEQRRRIRLLADDPQTAWRVDKRDRVELKKRDRFVKAAEEMFARTEAEYAPWTLVPATDPRWAVVQVYETVIARLEPRVAPHEAALPPKIVDELNRIEQVDHIDLISDHLPEQGGDRA